MLLVILLGFVTFIKGETSTELPMKPPHVVFLLADDLGYNDIGYSNYSTVETPFIDALAAEGLKLDFSYTPFVCTPSRAAIMTGKYPFRYGIQNSAYYSNEASGLDINLKLLPQYMREFGYQTHIVGKWHLGLCRSVYLPLNRGFDTFYGFLGGGMYYYNHSDLTGGLCDYWDNKRLNPKYVYSTDDFAEKTVNLINGYKEGDKPMFLYLALQAIHGPLETPPGSNVIPARTDDRLVTKEMIKTVDKFADKVVTALKQKSMWENTVFIFTSDNGGQPLSGGNNYPLRGGKHTLWEGGTRVRTFLHGPNVPPGQHYKGLFHAVDWLPTIAAIAGYKIEDKIDGVNQWEALKLNSGKLADQPRHMFLYNVDREYGEGYVLQERSAVRFRYEDEHGDLKDWKLIWGSPGFPSNRILPNRFFQNMDTSVRNYKSGLLFDMNVADYLLEKYPITRGHDGLVETMKDFIRIVYQTDWRYEPPKRLIPTSGRKYLGPGWC